MDFADVRATNLAVVLRFVREHAPCSRANIAADTGLNKATVSSLVTDLLERRLIRETGLTENRIGRPATMLVLDGSSYAAIGMEMNADHLTAVALDLAGEQLLSWRRSFAGLAVPPGKAVASLAALARRAVGKVRRDGRQVLGLTVGIPGLVARDGTVALSSQLGWRDVDPAAELTAALRPDYPVTVDKDANLAATAEIRYGANAGATDLVYLTGEVGIGAGVIADGRLLRGDRGFSGELGHLSLDPAGPECGCGRRGCLEALAGMTALLRRTSPETLTASAVDGPLTFRADVDLEPEIAEVARRAEAGDKPALAALAEVGGWLGHGAAVVASVVDPAVVVLGGYFAPLAPWVVPAAQAELERRIPAPGRTRIMACTLGHHATALGGAAHVLGSVDTGRMPHLVE